VIEFAQWDVNQSLKNIPNMLAEAFVLRKAPEAGIDPKPLDDTGATSDAIASYILSYRALLVEGLKDSAKMLRVWRQFDNVNDLNLEEVKSTYRTYVDSEFKRLGGLTSVLSPIAPETGTLLTNRFGELIESSTYRNGIGGDGQSYSFTDTEVSLMKATATKIFGSMRESLAEIDSTIMGEGTGLMDHPLSEEFANLLANRVETIVFSTMGASNSYSIQLPDDNGTIQSTTISLPTYSYPQKARLAAAKMLTPGRSIAPEWGLSEARNLKTKFNESLRQALTVDISEVDPATVPKPVSRWILDNREILKGL
jgi:hypothetical protein